MTLPPLHDHQKRAIQGCRDLWVDSNAFCVAAPCGAGKSRVMHEVAIPASDNGLRVCILSCRRLLTRQLIRGFEESSVRFGVLASGFERRDEDANIQICSAQTLFSRREKINFETDLTLVDEAHQQCNPRSLKVLDRIGGKRIGFTATPIGLEGYYEHIVEGGSYDEMLDCQMHLPLRAFAPSQPDLNRFKVITDGEFERAKVDKYFEPRTVFGDVFLHWKKHNPFQMATILFAGSVAHSRGWVEMFCDKGVRACHVDAQTITFTQKASNGKLVTKSFSSCERARADLFAGVEDGTYKVLCNRFVLREAIDLPYLYCCILATSMGSISSYLQSAGRIMRFHPDYDHKLLLDHGGNVNRHLLPNTNRYWSIGDTNNSVQSQIKKKKQQLKETEEAEGQEPITCPKCKATRAFGPQCPECGHTHKKSVRYVRHLDGTLHPVRGRSVRYKRPKDRFDDYLTPAIFRGARSHMSAGSVVGLAISAMRKAGYDSPIDTRTKLPERGSQEWNMPAKNFWPWAARRKS